MLDSIPHTPTEFRMNYLPNKNLQICHYSNLLGSDQTFKSRIFGLGSMNERRYFATSGFTEDVVGGHTDL